MLGSVQDVIEATNETLGLWTALAAIAAAVAAFAAVWSNRTTTKVLEEAQAKERPWLNASKAPLINRPGGFAVDFAIRNYGAALALRHRMKAWRCTATTDTELDQASSFTELVPTQELVWPLECKNFTPTEATYLVICISYDDTQNRPYQTWFYNWPIKADGSLRSALVHADVEPAEELRKRLARETRKL